MRAGPDRRTEKARGRAGERARTRVTKGDGGGGGEGAA